LALSALMAVGGYYLRNLLLLAQVEAVTGGTLTLPPPTATIGSPSVSYWGWVEMDVLVFLVNVFILTVVIFAIMYAYKVIRILIKYKFDTCERCYLKILFMVVRQEETVNFELRRVPLPLALCRVVQLPHPKVTIIKTLSICNNVVLVAWPSELVLECYGQHYEYALPAEIGIPFLIKDKVLRLWDERTAHPITFAIKTYRGCACDNLVSGWPSAPHQQLDSPRLSAHPSAPSDKGEIASLTTSTVLEKTPRLQSVSLWSDETPDGQSNSRLIGPILTSTPRRGRIHIESDVRGAFGELASIGGPPAVRRIAEPRLSRELERMSARYAPSPDRRPHMGITLMP